MNYADTRLAELHARIEELESKVEALRISRRVLMNLIDASEKEKREQLQRLENQNARLLHHNCRYARKLTSRNARISILENQLQLFLEGKNRPGSSTT